jgi:Niemann-Pick C1 protein
MYALKKANEILIYSFFQMVMTPFRFRKFAGSHEHIPGMKNVKDIVANVNVTYNTGTHGRMIPWSPAMVTWETDELITAEVYKNVVFSFLCVLATTFLLLANVRVCLFCGLCVIFTLTNVGGMMYFWGLTIDMISFIDLVLAVGL